MGERSYSNIKVIILCTIRKNRNHLSAKDAYNGLPVLHRISYREQNNNSEAYIIIIKEIISCIKNKCLIWHKMNGKKTTNWLKM